MSEPQQYVLAISTKTSGMPDFQAALDAQVQPDILSIAAVLFAPHWESDSTPIVSSYYSLCKPIQAVNWKEEHIIKSGITQEAVENLGIDLDTMLPVVYELCQKADLIIAYGKNFDKWMLRIAEARAFESDEFDALELTSVMQLATPVCRIAKVKGSGYKWPKLQEAYELLCVGTDEKPPDESEYGNALGDAVKTFDIWWAIVTNQEADDG